MGSGFNVALWKHAEKLIVCAFINVQPCCCGKDGRAEVATSSIPHSSALPERCLQAISEKCVLSSNPWREETDIELEELHINGNK